MTKQLLVDDSGFAMTEWAIVVGLVAFGVMASFAVLGGRLLGIMGGIRTHLGALAV
jgi:Flp pilus assembly pilin Flp